MHALLSNNADLNMKDKDGDTALSMAKKQGHTEIAELLKKYGATE